MIPNEVNIVLKEIWPMLLLFIIVIISIRIFDVIINKKDFVLYKDIYILCMVLYMFLLFELVTTTDFESYSNNFIPLKEILRYKVTSTLFYKNVLGNVFLFVPFGYCISNYIKSKKIIYPLLISIITSLSIELIQMNIGRSFDIDDILLNMIGGIIGYILFRLLLKVKNALPKCLKKEWLINIVWILLLIIVILFILNYYGLVIIK